MDSKKKDIKNLILVLSSAVLFACALVGMAVLYLGPKGEYKVQSVLINPDTLRTLSFESRDPQNGKRLKYHFDKIEYQDSKKISYNQIVSLEEFEKLFYTIASKNSLNENPLELDTNFQMGDYSILKVWVKGKHPLLDGLHQQIFQEIHFAKNGSGLFRIEIHQSQAEGKWAYFHSNSIKDKFSEWIQ